MSLDKKKPADGTLNWSFPLWSNLNVLANIDENENIYIATEDGNIFFLNADGTSNKAIYIENEVLRPLIIDVDGIIYLVSGKKIIAFYPDGTEKWSHEFTEDITASPIMDETGTIYVSTRDGKIWVIGE